MEENTCKSCDISIGNMISNNNFIVRKDSLKNGNLKIDIFDNSNIIIGENTVNNGEINCYSIVNTDIILFNNALQNGVM